MLMFTLAPKGIFYFFFDKLNFYGRTYFINGLFCLKNTGIEGRQYDKMEEQLLELVIFYSILILIMSSVTQNKSQHFSA